MTRHAPLLFTAAVAAVASTLVFAATPTPAPGARGAAPAETPGLPTPAATTPIPQEPPITLPRTLDPTGKPQINGPRVTSGTPGRPFLFRVPVTGERPMAFSADHLPDGLTLDPATGFISGSLKAPLSVATTIRAKNAKGEASRQLVIVGGHNKLALTPPLGWNSWNAVGMKPTDKLIRDTADAFVSSGFADHGYSYICVDDGWEIPLPGRGLRGAQGVQGTPRRAPDGTILTNQHFPDMKALGDYIHSKGLKFGMYSTPGPATCQGFEGSWQHEEIDARTWASWGVDYIKYDWCSYDQVARQAMGLPPATRGAGGGAATRAGGGGGGGATTRGARGARGGRGSQYDLPTLKKPYQVLRTAIDKLDRDMIMSMCQYGMGNSWEWAAEPGIGANLWRSTPDIRDNWPNVSNIGFSQNGNERFTKPGHWNDVDMLVVGVVGWTYETPHPSKLTHNEQLTHIGLWSILASPMILGNDMTKLDDFTIALMTNEEVLAVDQDALGSQGKRVWPPSPANTPNAAATAPQQVWARKLLDGTMAVGLFNLAEAPARVSISLRDLNESLGMNLSGRQPVRDLWQLRDLEPMSDAFSAEVPRHGMVFIKIGRPRPEADCIADIVKMHAPAPAP